MADVKKINENKSFPEPKGPKKKTEPEKDKFRDMMKIEKTDPDEQKKRKSQTEAEEEFLAKQKTSASRKKQTKKPSVYEPSSGKQPPSKDSKVSKRTSLPPSKKPSDSSTTTGETTSTAKEPTKKTASSQEPKKKAETNQTEGPKQHEKTAPPSSKTEKEKKKKAEETEEPILPPTEFTKKEQTAIQEVEKKKKVSEKLQEEDISLPSGAWEATQSDTTAEKKEKQEIDSTVSSFTESTSSSGKATETTTFQPLTSPFANLSPQVHKIFERMVGVMTVMSNSGVTETTIYLDSPQFEHSVFYGSEIIITEYSTAPKSFNIELVGNPNAVNLFVQNTEDLVAAFQKGGYTFEVNRIDTSLLPRMRKIKRKKSERVKRKKPGGG